MTSLETAVKETIHFAKLQKTWAVILGNATFLLFLVCSVNMGSTLWRVVLPPRQILWFYVFAQDFPPGKVFTITTFCHLSTDMRIQPGCHPVVSG